MIVLDIVGVFIEIEVHIVNARTLPVLVVFIVFPFKMLVEVPTGSTVIEELSLTKFAVTRNTLSQLSEGKKIFD